MGKWKQVKKRIGRCCQHRYITNIKEIIIELQLTPCYNCPRSPLLIGNHILAFDWCHFWWRWSTGHFSLGCHLHAHFSNLWQALASCGLPAIAELFVYIFPLVWYINQDRHTFVALLARVIITAQCTLVQSAVLRSHVVRPSVCPSVCDVGDLWSHRLEILETNCTGN